jgi:hypothetical protein
VKLKKGDKFEKRSQLFIAVHNEALTIPAMRVCNQAASFRSFRRFPHPGAIV